MRLVISSLSKRFSSSVLAVDGAGTTPVAVDRIAPLGVTLVACALVTLAALARRQHLRA